jgi:hypothetical protein
MYLTLPSTFGAANATIGAKKSERQVQKDVTIARESDDRIVAKYGGEDFAAYNVDLEAGTQSVEIAPGRNRSSTMKSLLNQALSGTGAVIVEIPQSQRLSLGALLEANGVDASVADGWLVQAPGKKSEPVRDGMTFPIL